MTAPDPIDEEVRAADRDRYDAARAAEAPARADLVTLYALNLELARTPWRVSEPQLGAMRLQWWADLFEAAETGAAPRGAPLVERISDWVRRRRPPQALLRALAEARLRELDDTPMESAEALDAFLSGTAGTLMRLAAWIACDGREDAVRDRAAADLGYAMGAAALLKAIPAYAARGRLMLPAPPGSLIPLADLERGATPEPLREACAALAERGLARLAAARAIRRQVDPAAAPALLAAARAEATLHAARKPDLDMVSDFAEPSEFRRRVTLLKASLLGW